MIQDIVPHEKSSNNEPSIKIYTLRYPSKMQTLHVSLLPSASECTIEIRKEESLKFFYSSKKHGRRLFHHFFFFINLWNGFCNNVCIKG